MGAEKRESGLTDEEFADFNGILQEFLKALIDFSDKHNIDRDSTVQYASKVFGVMSEISTFRNYKQGG